MNILDGRQSPVKLSAGCYIRPQIYAWKKLILDNAASLFARGAAVADGGEEEREREQAKLYAKIGQLTIERDFLAKRPGR